MSKRIRLAQLFDSLGATGLLLRLRSHAPSPWLSILTYHRVQPSAESTLFDDGVVDATTDEFDRQMGEVRKYFTPVGIDELCDFAAGGTLPRNPVAITFDDGYRDNFEIALPILQRHDCKAIFFIATWYMNERRVFWWDRISYLLKSARTDELVLEYPHAMRFSLADADGRRAATRAALKLVKQHYQLDLPRFLDELGRAAGVAWDDALERRLADELLMTWDQVRALRQAGMDVQSHTHTHRVLQTLEDERISDELIRSRAELERQLGEKVRAVSYPIGHTIDDRPFIREAVQQAGYELGFTNGTGPNHVWGKLDRFSVKRMSMESGPDALFRARMAFPYLR